MGMSAATLIRPVMTDEAEVPYFENDEVDYTVPSTDLEEIDEREES